jgi:hypothetical protein
MVTGVTFPLESLPAAVTARAETWATLGLSWRLHPVEPNHGKAIVIGKFESEAWLGDILIWITGEAELETIRLADDRAINKHYDLTHLADLNVLMDELGALQDHRVTQDHRPGRVPGPALGRQRLDLPRRVGRAGPARRSLAASAVRPDARAAVGLRRSRPGAMMAA